GVGSLVIGSLLFVIALVLAIEMKSLLIGEAADPAVEELIVTAIEESPSVVSLIHLRTEHLGPEDLLVVAKVEFQGHLLVRAHARLADAARRGGRGGGEHREEGAGPAPVLQRPGRPPGVPEGTAARRHPPRALTSD